MSILDFGIHPGMYAKMNTNRVMDFIVGLGDETERTGNGISCSCSLKQDNGFILQPTKQKDIGMF